MRALDGVDLEVRAGEVHCLLGPERRRQVHADQGARRRPPARRGRDPVDGEPVTHRAPRRRPASSASRRSTRSSTSSTGSPSPRTSSSATSSRRGGFSQRRAATGQHPRAARRLGHREISPHREVGRLSAAGKQIVSMARALSRDARVIVMDEPSAVLDAEEVENLFRVVHDLTRVGRRGRLHLAPPRGDPPDRRPDHGAQGRPDGRDRACRRATTPTAELIRLMTGRTVEYVFPPRADRSPTTPRRRAARSRASRSRGEFSDVSFDVRAGRDRRPRGPRRRRAAARSSRPSSAPAARPRARSRSAAGRCAPARCSAAVAAGVGLCPEERKSQGLILDEPVYRNISLSTLRAVRHASVPRRGRRARAPPSEQSTRSTSARRTPTASSRTLSGGNQQKVVLARWLLPAAGCCCSTSPPAASTSAPAPRSTR